jgi:hypothetical protein
MCDDLMAAGRCTYLDDDRTAAVHTAADDLITSVLRHRLGFSGYHGLIYIGCAPVYDAIYRDS